MIDKIFSMALLVWVEEHYTTKYGDLLLNSDFTSLQLHLGAS